MIVLRFVFFSARGSREPRNSIINKSTGSQGPIDDKYPEDVWHLCSDTSETMSPDPGSRETP